MSSGQRGGRPARSDKREAILQAAWKLIRHYGYAKTTMADIAREAGVGKGTAYLYFRSKEEIMLALVDKTNERITGELTEIASGGMSPRRKLRECLLHRVMRIYDLVHRYPHGEEVIGAMKPAIQQRIGRHVKEQGDLLTGILREGGFKDPEERGRLLAEVFELFTPPYSRFRSRKTFEQFVLQAADLALRGLEKRRALEGKAGKR